MATTQTTDASVAHPPIILPPVQWRESPWQSDRAPGSKVDLVVVHRWGERPIPDERKVYNGVVNWFCDQRENAQVSAHIVYGGSVAGEATQCVAWHRKAWACANFNSESDSIETPDAIWFGEDWVGFHVAARIVAKRLQARGIPPVWVHGPALHHGSRGFCRHLDLGYYGGNHPDCPSTDLSVWQMFVAAVQHEHARGGFRPIWGTS